MQIDQKIIDNYNQSKTHLQSIVDRFEMLVTKDLTISNDLFYKIKLSESSYDRVNIFFFDSKKNIQTSNKFEVNKYDLKKEEGFLFCASFDIKQNEEIKYELIFPSMFNKFYKEEIFKIQESMSFLKEVIKNIEITNQSLFNDIFQDYEKSFKNFKKHKKIMQENEKAYQDYLYSLTFDKIMTLFSKSEEMANDIYEDMISTYYTENMDQFVTIKRDFDKVMLRRVRVEAKYNQKLSLMYQDSRISKSDLKNKLEKDIILFNGSILNNIYEAINKLNIKDLPLYSEQSKVSEYAATYNINVFYDFFKKHIIANEF